MVDLSFATLFRGSEKFLLIFESGQIKKPIIILKDYDVRALNKEWNEKNE